MFVLSALVGVLQLHFLVVLHFFSLISLTYCCNNFTVYLSKYRSCFAACAQMTIFAIERVVEIVLVTGNSCLQYFVSDGLH